MIARYILSFFFVIVVTYSGESLGAPLEIAIESIRGDIDIQLVNKETFEVRTERRKEGAKRFIIRALSPAEYVLTLWPVEGHLVFESNCVYRTEILVKDEWNLCKVAIPVNRVTITIEDVKQTAPRIQTGGASILRIRRLENSQRVPELRWHCVLERDGANLVGVVEHLDLGEYEACFLTHETRFKELTLIPSGRFVVKDDREMKARLSWEGQ